MTLTNPKAEILRADGTVQEVKCSAPVVKHFEVDNMPVTKHTVMFEKPVTITGDDVFRVRWNETT
jgi:hypothetical protein